MSLGTFHFRLARAGSGGALQDISESLAPRKDARGTEKGTTELIPSSWRSADEAQDDQGRPLDNKLEAARRKHQGRDRKPGPSSKKGKNLVRYGFGFTTQPCSIGFRIKGKGTGRLRKEKWL